jgi:sugar phosphate isomerase/epimerase
MLLLHSETLIHYGLDRVFELAKKAGFDGLEIAIGENLDTQNVKYLKKLEKRHKIRIKAFTLTSKKEEDFIKIFQNVVKKFPETSINLNSAEVLSFKYKNWITKIAPALAKKYNLEFNRKNSVFKTFFGIFPSRSENSLYSLRDAGKVCLDLSALWASKEEIMRSLQFLGKDLQHIYLSNVNKSTLYYPPQTGILPIESFLTRLKQNNFEGDFTIKITPKLCREGQDEKVIEILVESRKFFEKYFK